MEKSHYKRYARVGPGGMNCTCCGPAPGKKRKWFMRLWKRQERREAEKQINRQLEEA